jgi:F-type H+-transporting ATPase subunit delta
MAGSAVAANYAEALLELATTSGRLEDYGRLIEATATALADSPEAQAVLASPKFAKSTKSALIGRAISAIGAPREFVLYLQAVVKRGRQGRFAEIAAAYAEMVDQKLNRVRATITTARPADPELKQAISASIAKTMGREVVATYGVDPELLGGAVVRVGDQVYDGSVRRRLVRLKRQLLGR